MNIAFIMDPLENVNPRKDTTYFLMLAYSQSGHQVFYLDQMDLVVKDGILRGNVTEVAVSQDVNQPFLPGNKNQIPMSQMDIIWVRTDPPFDRTYFYTTLLLDLLPPTTKVINRPSGLRNWNEKLSALFYRELGPTTLVSQTAAEIKAFMGEVGKITLKPIDGHGGKGIVFLGPKTENLDQLIDMVTHGGRHRVIAQTYVPQAASGDKRILLLQGEVLGGILRLHAEGKELNNLDAGGTAHPLKLNSKDLEICQMVKHGLLEQGIFFRGN